MTKRRSTSSAPAPHKSVMSPTVALMSGVTAGALGHIGLATSAVDWDAETFRLESLTPAGVLGGFTAAATVVAERAIAAPSGPKLTVRCGMIRATIGNAS